MRYTVKAKQQNSKMCLVCGLKNQFGLRASFYELDNDEVLAIFKVMEEHQSYPGRLHGGITTAILDETIGRAIVIKQQDLWGVTIKFSTRFKKPIPLVGEIRAIGRIDKDTRRYFEGSGEILLSDGSIAAVGHGKYIKLPIELISDFDVDKQVWRVVPSPDDPHEVEIY